MQKCEGNAGVFNARPGRPVSITSISSENYFCTFYMENADCIAGNTKTGPKP